MAHGKDGKLQVVLPASPAVGACQTAVMSDDDRYPAYEQREKRFQRDVVLENNV
jgi:hypothetical protein